MHLIKKGFLSFKLFTTDPQEKSCFPNRLTILYMVIKEILSPIFVKSQHEQAIVKRLTSSVG